MSNPAFPATFEIFTARGAFLEHVHNASKETLHARLDALEEEHGEDLIVHRDGDSLPEFERPTEPPSAPAASTPEA